MLEEVKSSYFIPCVSNQGLYYYIGSADNGPVETGCYGNYVTDSILGSVKREISDRFPIYFLTKREALYYLNKLEDTNLYPYEKLEIRTSTSTHNGKILKIDFCDCK